MRLCLPLVRNNDKLCTGRSLLETEFLALKTKRSSRQVGTYTNEDAMEENSNSMYIFLFLNKYMYSITTFAILATYNTPWAY